MLARELMTKKPFLIGVSTPIHKIVQLFLQLQISSAPVVDLQGHVMGLISDENLMKAFARSISTETSSQGLSQYPELLLPPRFVRVSDSLADVVSAILSCPTKRVLVQDSNHEVIGIISPKDILRALAGQKSTSLQFKLQDMEHKNKSLRDEMVEKDKGLEKFAHIMHDSPIMLFAVDQRGTISFANNMLIHFLGYDETGLAGKTIFDISPESIHDQIRSNLLNFNQNTKQKVDLISLQTHMGQKRRVEITFSAIQNDSGPCTEVLIAAHSVDSDELLRTLNQVKS